MNVAPILVPTLAELRIELERAMGLATVAERRCEVGPSPENDTAFAQAQATISGLLGEIAALPAMTPADVQAKALALSCLLGTPDSPEAAYTDNRLARQIVTALLNMDARALGATAL